MAAGHFPAIGEPLPTTWTWGADAADRVVRTMLRSTSSRARSRRPLRKDLSRRLHQISAISQAIDEDVESAAGKAAAARSDGDQILDDAYRKLGAGAELASIIGGAAKHMPAPLGIRTGRPTFSPPHWR